MMSQDKNLRFVTPSEAEHEQHGRRLHHWLSKPGLTEAENLVLVRAYMPPGDRHAFHRHPALEEIIYVLSGAAEQWVGEERRLLGPGDMAHIPADTVHATYNGGDEMLVFLAILSPARCEGPFSVDVFAEEPWCSLRAPTESPEPH
jgi:quercetin dioxygenase-like cupin family protein